MAQRGSDQHGPARDDELKRELANELRAGGPTRAEAWRPWRAYAVQHLWALGDHAINQMPGGGS